MGDVIPNYKIEVQKIKAQIAAQIANIERQTLEIMEIDDRKKRLEDNMIAAKKVIEDLAKTKENIESTHNL